MVNDHLAEGVTVGLDAGESDIRVLVLTTSYPLSPEATSGIFVQRLVLNLPSKVFAAVLTPSPAAEPTSLPEGVRVKCFRYAPGPLQLLAHSPGGIPVALRRNKLLYLLLPLLLGSMFVTVLRHMRRADVLHANWAINGAVGGLAAWIMRRPTVTTLRGMDVSLATRSRLHRAVLRQCLRLSHTVVTVSEAMRDAVALEFPRYRHKLRCVPNGVSPSLLELPARVGGHLRPDVFRLLTIGSLIPRKGIDTIIEALSLLKNVARSELRIVGAGPEHDRLQALAAHYGLQDRVRFEGAVAPERVASHLAQSDVFVLASHSEGRPNVLLEAFAANVPVVASDINGVRELVGQNERGVLFPAGDAEQLSERVLQLYESWSNAERRAAAARAYIVENGLLWSQTGEQYAALYCDAIATRPAS